MQENRPRRRKATYSYTDIQQQTTPPAQIPHSSISYPPQRFHSNSASNAPFVRQPMASHYGYNQPPVVEGSHLPKKKTKKRFSFTKAGIMAIGLITIFVIAMRYLIVPMLVFLGGILGG